MKHRSGQIGARQQRQRKRIEGKRKRIEDKKKELGEKEFFNVLSSAALREKAQGWLPEYRERLYCPTTTLSMFIKQALEEDRSCQRAVNGRAVERVASGLVQSVCTGGYCRARQRLPLALIEGLTREIGRQLSGLSVGWRWRGRTVKLVDGSTISMPDTRENQEHFPQPSGQASGIGFPIARIVAVICLSSGAVLQAGTGPVSGKGNGELGLLRGLLTGFCAGDVMLADSLYCNYALMAALDLAGVKVLFEQNGARHTDFRRGKRLGANDHLVHWQKPDYRPEQMSREEYEALPAQLLVREVKVGNQILVTTLLEGQISKAELAQLYKQRWDVELDLRNIKTTLGMEVLSCRTPSMVEKEMWVYWLAYNVIRLLMAQAASICGVGPREISFKHTVQMWTQWLCQSCSHRDAPPPTLFFKLIGQPRVRNRQGRVEPRARKRRPKPYPWLKVPRNDARQHIRAHGHELCA